MFAHGDDGRIPTVAVTGTNGKTTTARLIAHLFTAGPARGHDQHRRRVRERPPDRQRRLQRPQERPQRADASRCGRCRVRNRRGGILREGLGFDRCQVAVVTNMGAGDHLGLNYITTVEDLAVLKRVIVQNVATTGLRRAQRGRPIVAAMAPACPGKIIFFASDRHHPVIPRTAPGAIAPCTSMATPSWLPKARGVKPFTCATCPSHATARSASRSRTSWPPWPPPGRGHALADHPPGLSGF